MDKVHHTTVLDKATSVSWWQLMITHTKPLKGPILKMTEVQKVSRDCGLSPSFGLGGLKTGLNRTHPSICPNSHLYLSHTDLSELDVKSDV